LRAFTAFSAASFVLRAWSQMSIVLMVSETSMIAVAVATTSRCRRAHLKARSTTPGRRARIGSSARNRRRSAVSSWAVA
jgi:hypothetical protein